MPVRKRAKGVKARIPSATRSTGSATTKPSRDTDAQSQLTNMQKTGATEGPSVAHPPGPATPVRLPKVDPGMDIPDMFTHFPAIEDLLQTRTSEEQEAVAKRCLEFLNDPLNPLPSLKREAHVEFLEYALGPDVEGEQLSSRFTSLDAARPWILYWCLIGLHCLGEDISMYRARVVSTISKLQNSSGGYGGGYMQQSHLAPTYAAVLSLILVGGSEAYNSIDRKAMWRWISDRKQPDGGFTMSDGGEEDVRAVYCALCIISLLQLPIDLPNGTPGGLVEGTAEWIGRCQTYEGGLGGAPELEGHGGYVFCGLGALSILGGPWDLMKRHIDVEKCLSWITSRQYAPEGGFSGRTNKLVDGCYSTWVGGSFAMLEAALNPPPVDQEAPATALDSTWSREGLARYILCCCQAANGGLRDKPDKHPDFYHSCYVLQGLAAAQNYCFPIAPSTNSSSSFVPPLPSPFNWSYTSDIPTSRPGIPELVPSCYDPNPLLIDEELDAQTRGVRWYENMQRLDRSGEEWELWKSSSRVAPVHPVFNLPFEQVDDARKYYAAKGL